MQQQLARLEPPMTTPEPCSPLLHRIGFSKSQFYSEKDKILFCLPTKTGSTNWLRLLNSIVVFNGDRDAKTIDSEEVWNGVEAPTMRDDLIPFRKVRTGKDG